MKINNLLYNQKNKKGADLIEGDKWKVKQDCNVAKIYLKSGDILTEKRGYNFDTECREECGDYNELHNDSGFVCDVGSIFAKKNLEKINTEE